MDRFFLELISEVELKREEIRCSRSGAFFRGHSRKEYELVPSLLRRQLRPDTEHNLYHECFARAGNLLARDSTSWERLGFLQHYGIPTRLLDWTESFGVALFFALTGNCSEPHLWIVNAFNLNRELDGIKQPRILLAGLDRMPDYHDCFVRLDSPSPWPFAKPIFLQIPWSTDRLRAQSGFFTFHSDAEPLNKTFPKHVRRVDIPRDAMPGARKFLAHAGITEHTVFPDFVGLAAYLRERYRV
jgi:hypothetical protein